MATIRERHRGVWEVRVFTGRDATGRPTQVIRTLKVTERDAQRLAASLESRPAPRAAGRSWIDYQAKEAYELTPTQARFAQLGVVLEVGRHVVVGADDAEPGRCRGGRHSQ